MSDTNTTTTTATETPVILNAKKIIEARRSTTDEMVSAKMTELKKPITHTGLFHEIFPGHAEGKEAIRKWNDIGRVLAAKVTSGEYTVTKVEGKRRTTYQLASSHGENAMKAVVEIPAEENTGSDI